MTYIFEFIHVVDSAGLELICWDHIYQNLLLASQRVLRYSATRKFFRVASIERK